MVNAITVAAEFISWCPLPRGPSTPAVARLLPPHGDSRHGVRGHTLYIVRDHDSRIFSQRQQTLKDIAAF